MSKATELAKKYSEEELIKKFDALPEKLRGVLLATKTLDTLGSIAKENDIAKNFEKLRRYTILVLAGVVPITLLRETLQEELQIDEERARKIATEIRDTIFVQVKDELRKIHNLK